MLLDKLSAFANAKLTSLFEGTLSPAKMAATLMRFLAWASLP